MPGISVPGFTLRYLGSESELAIIAGICVPCAVTLTPSARYPEAQTAPSRPDAPNRRQGFSLQHCTPLDTDPSGAADFDLSEHSLMSQRTAARPRLPAC